MSQIVLGNDVEIYIFDSGLWKPYACARSATLNVITEFIETSAPGNGKFASYIPTKNSFTGSLDGVTSINIIGQLSLADMRQKQLAQTSFLMRFQRTSQAGDVYTDEATFFITNSTDSGSYDGVATFSLSLQGTGDITQVFTPIIPVPIGGLLVNRYERTATGGESGFTDSYLINKVILEVNVDGISDGKIIISGTPLGTEVLYDSTTGTFTWGIPFEAGEEIYILYQDL